MPSPQQWPMAPTLAMPTHHKSSESLAKAFLHRHAHLAYDDATNRSFWVKAAEQGATVAANTVRFPDGSTITRDAMACSLTAS